MCARRFLSIIFVLTLIVVVGAFAVFQFGGNVLLKQATPQGHFQAAAAGGGPDYADPSAWLARPGMAGNPALWVPDGVEGPLNPGPAAIFYIHPTTYLERDRWNAPIDIGGETGLRTLLFARSQASAFNAAGEIWAYADVAAAFDRFLAEAGDRPIILAGHSQGALHLMRLLKEKVAGKPVAKRIVAAYVIGWPVSRTADLPALGLPACAGPKETHCLLSWMSFGDPANPDLVLNSYNGTAGLAGGKRTREDMICTNPISGTLGGAAPASANPGTLIPTADLSSATLEAGRIGAHCDHGLLIVDGDIPPLGPFVLPGNNYHVYDYALFWGAVRRDADRRMAAWTR